MPKRGGSKAAQFFVTKNVPQIWPFKKGGLGDCLIFLEHLLQLGCPYVGVWGLESGNSGNAQIYTAFVLKALPYVLATPISLYLLSVCQKEVY